MAITRSNNLDFLRIFAASLVVISHQHALTGLSEPIVYQSISFGELGVLIFFSVSGFLISQSWNQDPHPVRFVVKRFLRIWPGLVVVTLIAALVLGPIVSNLHWRDYFSHPDLLSFLENLRLKTHFALPGVFGNNPHPSSVNGSLWTIPIEVGCYLVLFLLGCAGLTRRPWAILICSVLFAAYYFLVGAASEIKAYHFALFFIAGACLDVFRNQWQLKPHYLLTVAGGAAIAFHLAGAEQLAALAAIPVLTIYVGTRTTPILRSFGRFGDISYGIYIYAFPVQQTLIWALGRNLPLLSGLLITAVITAAFAFASWHLVERPALNLKRFLPPKKQPSTLT